MRRRCHAEGGIDGDGVADAAEQRKQGNHPERRQTHARKEEQGDQGADAEAQRGDVPTREHALAAGARHQNEAGPDADRGCNREPAGARGKRCARGVRKRAAPVGAGQGKRRPVKAGCDNARREKSRAAYLHDGSSRRNRPG